MRAVPRVRTALDRSHPLHCFLPALIDPSQHLVFPLGVGDFAPVEQCFVRPAYYVLWFLPARK